MKTRRGGKILGKGANARVVYPAIPCKDGRNMTRKVSRVLVKDRRERNDLLGNHPVLEILKTIDPEQKYFLYPETCEPGELLPENIEDGIDEEDKYHSEIMDLGGVTWSQFNRNHKASERQKKHILTAMKKLHEAGAIHADLHSYNIVMGSDNLPRIIDFGHAKVNVPQEVIDLEDESIKQIYPKFRISKASKTLVKMRTKIREILTKNGI
jgi:serine/threonine protein kinase